MTALKTSFYSVSIVCALMALPVSAALAAPAVTAMASFSILGDMVSRVGGARVAVTTIVGPNADTHVYEPTPRDAVALAGAQVFFVNGLGFEGWLDRLVESTGFAGPLVVTSTGITPHEMSEDGTVATDPHAWQSLQNALIYVDNIAAGLCAADAAGCAVYRENAEAYGKEITALDDEIMARIQAIPEARRKVITTHDAFGYFSARYGVAFLAPTGFSTESEASAGAVAKLIGQIRSEGVSALFIETMSDGRLIDQIAKETGAAIGGALYADALSDADEDAGTYLDMFRHNVSLLVPAMGGQ